MSTLYQLRGRVGRSTTQAYAYFMTDGGTITNNAAERLDAMQRYAKLGSGFDLATADLAMRGGGDYSAHAQSGQSKLSGDEMRQLMAEALVKIKSEIILSGVI